MAAKINRVRQKVSGAIHSRPGHDVLLYLFFVVVAFVLWVLMSMDSEVQRDYEIPVELTDVPDSVVVINSLPPTVSVSVKGRSGQLIRQMWRRRVPPLRFKFADYVADHSSTFSVNSSKLDGRLRDYFGQGVTFVAIKPDSLTATFTTGPGVRLPVIVDASVRPALECIRSGAITVSADSVTVYSAKRLPASLKAVHTVAIERSDVSDTLRLNVALRHIDGARCVPDHIEVTVPVEPLISKRATVDVEIVNTPVDRAVVMFPTKVDVTYLVPMSRYKEVANLHVFADYNDIARLSGRGNGQKLPLNMAFDSEVVTSPELHTDSVEYIVEHNVKL